MLGGDGPLVEPGIGGSIKIGVIVLVGWRLSRLLADPSTDAEDDSRVCEALPWRVRPESTLSIALGWFGILKEKVHGLPMISSAELI